MPKKVGRVHDHLLPPAVNQEVGDVWSCDCGRLFVVKGGGVGGKEKAYDLIENDPSLVDFTETEPVEAPAEEESTEEPAKE